MSRNRSRTGRFESAEGGLGFDLQNTEKARETVRARRVYSWASSD